MARQAADREDLFGELVTHHPRWEVRLFVTGEILVIGIRADGRWTVYRGNGDYYQLLSTGQLRRAFQGDHPLLSTGLTLAVLTRHRTDTTSTLVRQELTQEELARFIHEMRDSLRSLRKQFLSGQFQVERSSSEPPDFAAFVCPLLELAICVEPALAPGMARESAANRILKSRRQQLS